MTIFKLDSNEFNRTIEDYITLSRKDLLLETNRRAANICARAAFLTPRASSDRIVKDMKAIETVTASYVKETKRRGLYTAFSKGGKTTQGKLTVGYMGKAEGYAIANWRLQRGKRIGIYAKFPPKLAGPGRGKKGQGGGTAGQYYQAFVRRAKSSRAYIAAGWLKAFNTFKDVIGSAKTVKPDLTAKDGSSGLGYGKPAVLVGDVFRAVFTNITRGVDKIGRKPLRVAMKIEENDMKDYIEGKIQKLLNNLARS